MFTIEKQDPLTRARTGKLVLEHGLMETPLFMPVGTNSAVKSLTHDQVSDIGYKLILSNTYHLYLRPGIDVIRRAGGLHQFAHWKGNILTDSGGYQVFSLAPFRKIRPEGVRFRSHIDGAYHWLTPEKVIDLQEGFGSDVLMPLDVCTAPDIPYKKALEAMHTTHKWASISRDEWLVKRESGFYGQLFGIVQGNFFKDLRTQSAEYLTQLNLPGYAIGGLSVGESPEVFEEFTEFTAPLLPANKPRYIMGIGTPEYILTAVENGIDMFDCVYPTRIARNGSVFTTKGIIDLKKSLHEYAFDPIEEKCQCYACRNYTKAYLRQLFKAREILGPVLATIHNLHFLYDFMDNIKSSIRHGTFGTFKRDFLSNYAPL